MLGSRAIPHDRLAQPRGHRMRYDGKLVLEDGSVYPAASFGGDP